MTRVYLGLGANIEPASSLKAGIFELEQCFGKLNMSPIYLAPAVGIDGPDFHNMVVGFDCQLSYAQLIRWIADTETKYGRQRPADPNSKPTSHGLDMDLLLFGNMVDDTKNVPRVDILTCAYVLQPLLDIAPDLMHPKQGERLQDINAITDPTHRYFLVALGCLTLDVSVWHPVRCKLLADADSC